MTTTFTLNGQTYSTDAETAALVRKCVARVKAGADTSALFAVMHWGQKSGRIVEAA